MKSQFLVKRIVGIMVQKISPKQFDVIWLYIQFEYLEFREMLF